MNNTLKTFLSNLWLVLVIITLFSLTFFLRLWLIVPGLFCFFFGQAIWRRLRERAELEDKPVAKISSAPMGDVQLSAHVLSPRDKPFVQIYDESATVWLRTYDIEWNLPKGRTFAVPNEIVFVTGRLTSLSSKDPCPFTPQITSVEKKREDLEGAWEAAMRKLESKEPGQPLEGTHEVLVLLPRAQDAGVIQVFTGDKIKDRGQVNKRLIFDSVGFVVSALWLFHMISEYSYAEYVSRLLKLIFEGS